MESLHVCTFYTGKREGGGGIVHDRYNLWKAKQKHTKFYSGTKEVLHIFEFYDQNEERQIGMNSGICFVLYARSQRKYSTYVPNICNTVCDVATKNRQFISWWMKCRVGTGVNCQLNRLMRFSERKKKPLVIAQLAYTLSFCDFCDKPEL